MNISNTKASLQDRIYELLKPFRDLKAIWQVRIEASRALLDLEFHFKGIDAALLLFTKYVEEEPSLRGCDSFPWRGSMMLFGNLENGLELVKLKPYIKT